MAEKAIFHGVVCISIHALREEGDARRFERRQMQAISIHALREEGDRGGRRSGLLSCHFYPRPPRGGRPDETGRYRRAYRFLSTPSARRATQVNDGVAVVEEFLSTPSARRATPLNRRTIMQQVNFYPRPPRGGRLGRAERTNHARAISIHALREEGDQLFGVGCGLLWNFYPRPPRGGRRPSRSFLPGCRYFYPRPPRGGRPNKIIYFSLTDNFYPRPPRGGRHLSDTRLSIRSNFYPRPPRGGRRYWCKYKRVPYLFLSTPSARRATRQLAGNNQAGLISIHALREEGDPFCPVRPEGRWRFLSTPSARRATRRSWQGVQLRSISIHALREEGDWSLSGQTTAF